MKPKTSHGEGKRTGVGEMKGCSWGAQARGQTPGTRPWRKVHSSLLPHPRFLEASPGLRLPPGLRTESVAECVARPDRRPPESEPTSDRARAAHAEFPEAWGRGAAAPVGLEPAGGSEPRHGQKSW